MPVIELHPYKPISCADYEYIEIACMDQNDVDVVTATGTVSGLAVTTETNSKGEFFIVGLQNGEQISIRVDRIRKLVVRSTRRRFDERAFSGPEN